MIDSRESTIPQSLVLKAPRRQIAIILLATFVAALSAGGPTLKCGFTSGDDQRFITDHFLVAHPSIGNAVKLLTIVHGDLYQPLPMLTFQANFALAQNQPQDRFGISPFAFHLTNVVLHALNALFVTLIALRMSRRASIALITGLLFACHPFATETVAWVSGRMMLLSTTFALVTIWLCLSKRPHKRFASGVTWLLSLASKVQPTVPLAAAWIDYQQHGKFDRRTTLTHCFLLVMALAASAFAIFTSRQAGFVGDDTEFKSTPAVRVLLASRYYLENYVVPTGLSPWVPPPDGVALASTECLIGIVEWIGLLFIAVLCRRRFPIATLGIAAFAILLLPYLAAPAARRFLAADRYMYLPIFGLHLVAATLLVAFSDAVDRLLKPSFRHRFLILPTAAILLPCLLLSWTYSLSWTDTITREVRAAFVYPDNPLTHYELAKAYNLTGRPHDALDVITKARNRWPEHPRLAAQAGEALRLLEDWPAAERDLREAAEKMPGHTVTHYHLALVLEHLNRDEESVRILESLVARNPGFLPAWTALGRLSWAAGDEKSAIEAYETALKINPNHRGALLSLAELYASKQDWTAAIDLLNKITASDSRDARAGFQLAVALVQIGRLSEAFDIYSRLIDHDDANTALRFNRAAVAEQLGNTAVAEQDYLYVIAERPEFLEPYIALYEILAAERRFDRMIELWQHREAELPNQDAAKAALIWAYLLANQWERAAPLFEDVADDSPVAGMVRWATASHLLMTGDDAALREWIKQAQSSELTAFVSDASDDWRMRIIQSSIDALPDSIKKSRAGHVFLAEFLVMRNQRDAAMTTLERVVTENPNDEWGRFANDRIRELKMEKEMPTGHPR